MHFVNKFPLVIYNSGDCICTSLCEKYAMTMVFYVSLPFCFLVDSLKIYGRGFSEYMANGGELAYQKLCGSITAEFNDCSKQVSSSCLIFFLYP